jgi:hypothetical protein
MRLSSIAFKSPFPITHVMTARRGNAMPTSPRRRMTQPQCGYTTSSPGDAFRASDRTL